MTTTELSRNERIVLECLVEKYGSPIQFGQHLDMLGGLNAQAAGIIASKLQLRRLARMVRAVGRGKPKLWVATSEGRDAMKGFDVGKTNGTGPGAAIETPRKFDFTDTAIGESKLSASASSTQDQPTPADRVVFVMSDQQLTKFFSQHVNVANTDLETARTRLRSAQHEMDRLVQRNLEADARIRALEEERDAALGLATELETKLGQIQSLFQTNHAKTES